MTNHIHLLIREREDKIGMAIIHQNPVKAGMVAEVKDYEFSSWDEYIDKNSTLFPLQQLPADTKKSLLIELKGKRASLRQLERLTGISKSMIYRM